MVVVSLLPDAIDVVNSLVYQRHAWIESAIGEAVFACIQQNGP